MIFDLIIIGGGINGAAIARDAAGRGLSALLAEQGDLACATSSASTKLIHGGLRYLERYEFRLVHEALAERELLLSAAPHLIRPLRFVMPHERSVRPAWLIRLGLFLYDHLAKRRRIPHSDMLALSKHPFGAPLKGGYKIGFSYYDCQVDDSRLVVMNALDAYERGAKIRVGAKLTDAAREGSLWRATLTDDNGRAERVSARALVNAAGPWVSQVQERLGLHSTKHVRLVKGSHIVTHKLYDGEHAYIFQNPDRRIVFAIPFEQDFTLIGTTDEPHDGPPGEVAISEEETRYLLESVDHFFERPVTANDVVWSFSGLRPLYDDGSLEASVVTRDYAFDLDASAGLAPVLSIFGGKITTARRLAEHAFDELRPFLPHMGSAWTRDACLPGGDLGEGSFEAFAAGLAQRAPFLGPRGARRIAAAYGSRAWRFLDGARSMADLGEDYGLGFSDAELAYLCEHEWARSIDDVLWRRSKLGLHLTPAQQKAAARGFARIAASKAMSG